MGRNRSESGWRASAVAVALFAITLNFLQPLAHAALMRDGAPSILWGTFCSAAAADPGADRRSTPVPVDTRECCLGFAHAVALTTPSGATFVPVEPVFAAVLSLLALEQPSPVGIRDDPPRPRGPPSLA
jgi:hypothetical protein